MSDKTREERTVHVVSQQSNALPALVNFFVPTLGQLIQGRILAVLMWWLASAAVIIVTTLLTAGIGLILVVPILWIACIVDAAKYKPT